METLKRPVPMKSVVFEILLLLSEGELHGYAIVKCLEKGGRLGGRILPGNLYRTLRQMMAENLIVESGNRPDPNLDDQRRRYFAITEAGRRAAKFEAGRLESLLEDARKLRLLGSPAGEPEL